MWFIRVILGIFLFSFSAFAQEKALFAGGCFWCLEAPFDEIPGVLQTTSGYADGKKKNPTYEQVSTGKTGHVEAVLVEYDSSRVSFSKLLDVFWKQIDPTDDGGQYVDRGPQYRAVIFYFNEKQKIMAEKSKAKINESPKYKNKVVTPIEKYTSFFPAEIYHQDYYKKEPEKYRRYKSGSGRPTTK